MTQILLVADEPGFRDRLGLALERLELSGEEVSFLEAANGNDALVLAEAHQPDLVVADVSVTPYVGFGLTISALLLLAAILAWQLGSLPPQTLRLTAWVLTLTFAAMTVLNWMYFFTIPVVFSSLITVCLAAAALRSPRAA